MYRPILMLVPIFAATWDTFNLSCLVMTSPLLMNVSVSIKSGAKQDQDSGTDEICGSTLNRKLCKWTTLVAPLLVTALSETWVSSLLFSLQW